MTACAYVHAYPGAAATLALLWPGFAKLGLPLIGVDCVGEPCAWPEPLPVIEAGYNAYATADNYNLPSRMVLTLAHFLTTEFDRCLICEYDTLFLKKMPDYPPGFTAQMAGGRIDGSEASCFWHCPWICDRDSAKDIIRIGTDVMMDGTVGRGPRGVHGSPDVFLGLIMDRGGLRFNDSGTFSRNTIHSAEDVTAANEAIRNGAWALHGIKTKAQLDALCI